MTNTFPDLKGLFMNKILFFEYLVYLSRDTRLMGIHRLNNEYCVEQLKINLAKEMPEVKIF